jgi:hypothetical protein
VRLPSLVSLAQGSRAVFQRFPWTMAASTIAAVTAILATTEGADADWQRITAVAALGLPVTVALTLLAEERGWRGIRGAVLNLAGISLLILFYLVWPGLDRKHEAIRYFQLSAGLHLLVAFLPFLGQRETGAFWQYNRRLFLGFLRAALFSQVLFYGLAIALGAVDQLLGVDVPGELYGRMGIVIAFVVNTAIFLSVVPLGLRELDADTEYPRVLKVFAQYILTPLVFIYLLILCVYLVKIVVGGEWPSGWIGWLVASVAVAGLLGFLLVHPLRDDPEEPWIRTYSRWLFVGLIPAAAMLLVAFWKRVLPYGLTEPRLLGILLGFWLLAIAVSYTLRQRAPIRWIPVTLAMVLLLTLYGPLSVTGLSIASQARRLRELVTKSHAGQRNEREASGALRFLLDHTARRQIAAAIPGELPSIDWKRVADNRHDRDSTAGRILAVAGMRYFAEHAATRSDYFYFSSQRETATRVAGYDWMVRITSSREAIVAGGDSIRVLGPGNIARVTAGRDTLVFDLASLARTLTADPAVVSYDVSPGHLQLQVTTPRRALLALESLNGHRVGDSVRVQGWYGTLFLGQ